MPQTTEEIQLVPQDRMLERFVEENIDVLVIKLVPQERIPEHTVEETIHVPVSQVNGAHDQIRAVHLPEAGAGCFARAANSATNRRGGQCCSSKARATAYAI